MTTPPETETVQATAPLPGADPAALATYLGDVEADDFLTQCVQVATEMVTTHIGAAQIPTPVVARAVLEVAAELWNRRTAPNGVASFGDGAGGVIPMRVARDAMVAARPLLAPWIGLGIA